MVNFSKKKFVTYLLIGGICALCYMILGHSSSLLNKIIDSFFIGSMIPLILGAFRLVKKLGLFHLFVYSHRKFWKFGKRHEQFEEENEQIAPDSTEKLGSYYDYLTSKKEGPPCAEPLLAGGLYLAFSLILLFVPYL